MGRNLGVEPCSKWCQADIESGMSPTHQFEPGFPIARNSDGLETVLSRDVVIEPDECLVRLHTSSAIILSNLESDPQDVLWAEPNWRGLFGQRDTRVHASTLTALASHNQEIDGNTYGSERI